MGTDIDTIFKMLSWNSSEKEQLRGIDEAKKIEYLSVLFQPIEDKSVWENCAKVISSKSDNELKKYMNNILSLIFDILRVKVYKPQDFQLVQTNSPANLYLDISVLFLLHICNFPLYNLHSFA